MTERISGGSRGGAHPLFSDQNEAQGAGNIFLETPPPPSLTEGLDPPLRIGVEHKDNDFLFLFLNFDTVLKIQLQKSFLTFDELNEME